jgi:hypothetical protein
MGEKSERVQIRDVDAGDGARPVSYTKSFIVEDQDPVTGKKQVGTFTVKRITIGDLSTYGMLKARMAGGQVNLDPVPAWINEQIALCQVALTETPKWWNPAELFDDELLNEVYNHVRQFQDSFRILVGEGRGQAQDGGSPAIGAGVAPALVVQEVRAAK